jgi:hypothetical protein
MKICISKRNPGGSVKRSDVWHTGGKNGKENLHTVSTVKRLLKT